MAIQVFKESGINMILSGHIHEGYTRLENGIIICHAGSSTSDCLIKKQENNFIIITGDRTCIEIKKMEWNNENYLFACRLTFKRTREKWQNA